MDPETAQRTREVVERAMDRIAASGAWRRVPGEGEREGACIILSGGLDTSIVAEAGAKRLGITDAFTVIASPSATDEEYASAIANKMGLRHHILRPPEGGLAAMLDDHLPWVVRTLRSFDGMALRNDLAVGVALRAAHGMGFRKAVTGDAADELFCGYAFAQRLQEPEWSAQRREMAASMTFDAVPLGASLGVAVASPFLDPEVASHALSLGRDDCVGAIRGDPGGPTHGKLALREAFPAVHSVRRGKDPIEVGSGTTVLGSRPWLGEPGWFDGRITEEEFDRAAASARAEGVALRDREHLAYYRVFRAAFPDLGAVPGRPRLPVGEAPEGTPGGEAWCAGCRFALRPATQKFCVTCGHFDGSGAAIK